MFPITADVVRAEQNRRLEGYRRWSLRRGGVGATDIDGTRRPENGHLPKLRPAFGR